MTEFPLPPTLATDLQQVEHIVLERTRSRAAVISVAGSGLLRPGAERLRAALVLMAAQTGEYRRERVVHAAAAAELIYAATRTHDELVDEGARRRGEPRLDEWNHGVGLMVGDYLFALAAGEMALSPEPRVITFYSQAVIQITEATLLPPSPLSPLEEARVRHLERAAGASAALIAAACRAGGACVGVLPEHVEALGRYGTDLGLALRLGDEARDFAEGVPAPGASLRAGVITLPLIFTAASVGDSPLLAALDGGEPAAQEWAITEVRRHGLSPIRAEIARLAAQSRVALTALPPGEAREALARVADFAVARAAL